MEKAHVYLRKGELNALRALAKRSGRSVAGVIRDALRRTVLRQTAKGPIALWDGEPKRAAVEHDTVHDDR